MTIIPTKHNIFVKSASSGFSWLMLEACAGSDLNWSRMKFGNCLENWQAH